MTGSSIPGHIPALTPELFDRLRERVQKRLIHLVKANKNTRHVRESPVFCDFRKALDAIGDSNDAVRDDSLLENFRTTIPLTGYDTYEPFVNRLIIDNANEKDVKDMFAPGLPYFIACSSATSGRKAKMFAKYRPAERSSLEELYKHANPVSTQGGKICSVHTLLYRRVIDVLNDDNVVVRRMPLTSLSSGINRMQCDMDVDKDPSLMTFTAPRASSPVAVGFIANYRTFLLTHALFALAEPKIEAFNTIFGCVFVDMMRFMEEEWDSLVNAIETGILPDWEGAGHVRQYLEPKFSANLERAAQLRDIGKVTKQPGWVKNIWPQIRVVIGIVSGAFSIIVPKMRHYLGPDVHMASLGFIASEAYIGSAFSPADPSLFKATNDDFVEYLDISGPETASNLALAHEVEVGHRYEIVVTARDGLWRYRLGDVVEIAGFDATDGTPILRYIERRGTFVRIESAFISGEDLRNAIFSAQDVLGPIAEMTVIVDQQKLPASLAFLVEIDGELSTSANQAPTRIEASLRNSNENVAGLLDRGVLTSPTIHVLTAGAFREYREIKIKASITGTCQIKVPIVLWDHEVQEWMLQRVEKVIVRHN